MNWLLVSVAAVLLYEAMRCVCVARSTGHERWNTLAVVLTVSALACFQIYMANRYGLTKVDR